MNVNNLKIGFITKEDPEDTGAWLGTHYYIFKSLQKNVGETIPLGPIQPEFLLLHKIIAKIFIFIVSL